MSHTLRDRGVSSETRPCPPRGDAVVASVGAGPGGTLLLGHLDTVWPVGSLAELPFGVQDGHISGPGVFDMKGGIALAMAVLAELARRTAIPPVSLLLVPDEEVGTAASMELLLSLARGSARVLVLEPPLDGAAKIARKGTGQFDLHFTGRAAHAGLEPEKGASALAAMSRAVLFLESLGDPLRGTTVTPTVATSGTKTNVVPEQATLLVDVRVWSQDEATRVEAAVRGFAPADTRVSLRIVGGFDRPPLEPTPASEALYARARRIAAELGFELGAARVGGASDGNLTAAAGIPTLDGLGPNGRGAHARDECVFVDDLVRRAELLLRLLSEPS